MWLPTRARVALRAKRKDARDRQHDAADERHGLVIPISHKAFRQFCGFEHQEYERYHHDCRKQKADEPEESGSRDMRWKERVGFVWSSNKKPEKDDCGNPINSKTDMVWPNPVRYFFDGLGRECSFQSPNATD